MSRRFFNVIAPLFVLVALSTAVLRAEEDVKAKALAASDKGSKFLISQANDDGTFGKGPGAKTPGIVGIALTGLGTTQGITAATPAVAKAAEYIASAQKPDGSIVTSLGNENYNTSIAVLGLKAINDPKYASVLEKAKAYILKCQLGPEQGYNKDEHFLAFGGFSYGSNRKPDVSNSAFALEALKEMGLEENSVAFKNAIVFIRRCQDSVETNDFPGAKDGDNTGGFVYRVGDSEFDEYKARNGKMVPKPYGNMTYSAIKSLLYCGMKADSPELQAASKWIRTNYNVKENPGGEGSEGYYYYIIAFAKAFTAMGVKEIELADGKKVNWAKDLASHLIATQQADGSWVNKASRWYESDPVLTTSYALKALNLAIKALE